MIDLNIASSKDTLTDWEAPGVTAYYFAGCMGPSSPRQRQVALRSVCCNDPERRFRGNYGQKAWEGLDLLNSPNNCKEQPGATSAPAPSLKPIASQPRILVAEDDPYDVFLLKRAFAKGGVQVPMDFVKDGQEAIDYLQEKPLVADGMLTPPPTMLILDLKMPRLDGFEVLEWIRHQPKLRTMFVAILSSSGLEQDKRRAYALGADNYAVKPSDPSEMIRLAQRLEAHCSGKNTTASSDPLTG